MTKYVVAGHFGPDDRLDRRTTEREVLGRFDLGASRPELGFGVAGLFGSLRKLNVLPSETGIDLLLLALHVHIADIRLNRRTCSEDGWTRQIAVVVPVSEPDRWRSATATLKTMLRFLTGDHWEFEFRPRPASTTVLAPPRIPKLDDPQFDGVSLYSGGLDSLIGLIDTVAEDEWPLFVSHAGESAVSSPQNKLFKGVQEATADGNRKIDRLRYTARFPRTLIEGVVPENTTRGRSFLFLALGAMAGSGLGTSFKLRIPENGFIALNVPLDPTRLGASTTRTTHPFYLHRWNDLLNIVGIPGLVENRYQSKTKGEMITGCARPEVLKRFLSLSLSCAHPSTSRFNEVRHAHCGVCVPCLIRRAAIEEARLDGGDPTGYRHADLRATAFDSMKAEGEQIRGYQYAIERLQACPDLARILIHKPGPLAEDIERLDELAGVYSRGMAEVGRLLEGVRTFSSMMG